MILYQAPDVNPDVYSYETSFTFAQDYCKELLKKIINDKSFLILRKRYLDPEKHLSEIFQQLPSMSDRKKFMKRSRQILDKYANQKKIQFEQYFIPPDMEKEFLSLFPQWVIDLKPDVSIQISYGGDYLPPHQGHTRKSSLFMLLQGHGEETHWHRETESFEVYDFFRVPDLEKIEPMVKAELQPFVWTLFNHKQWHSVHGFTDSGIRINIGLDFAEPDAVQLLEIIKQHENNPNA